MVDSPDPEGVAFNAARRLPAGQRAAYLENACGDDTALRQRVEELLRADEQAGGFLETPAPGVGILPPAALAAGAGGSIRPSTVPSEKAGDRIGRYRLLQQIGEGGCGVVYMAEQQEPVRRQVALKVIKLGMDTRNVIARFEAERQALALMDHPNIAKVLDAGATDTGRPYFVMELVRGVKITDYCDQNELSTRERLDLFIQVCEAIQHAHQKGIIHRDIKPSNILVTQRDGVPVPKVIDFGIAKATTDQRLTDKTLFTAFEQFIGTPAYMSPEQAEMSELGIDTRSDIYSLGVLLYELLTGQTPFDSNTMLHSGLHEIRRVIREEEPLRPSTRLRTMVEGDLKLAARSRRADPAQLSALIRGDLDWIVMKCLDKDRSRRYKTANGLAADLNRHLQNEPVVARPPSTAYRLQKAWRRHRVVLMAAILMATVLVAATGISAWQAIRATRAETLANQRLADAEAISQFLAEVFYSPDPSDDGRSITVVEALGAAAKKLETDLAGQPARRAKLQATLGITYYGLGLYREAVPLQERVRDYYMAVLGPQHPDTLNAMTHLAMYYAAVDRRDEALKLQEQVVSVSRKVNGPEHPDTLDAMQELAFSYDTTGRRDDALKLEEQLLSLSRKVKGPENRDTLKAMQTLAASYVKVGRQDEAFKLMEQVLPLSRKINGPEDPLTIWAMHGLANACTAVGRQPEALALLERVMPLSRKVNGPEHLNTLWAMQDLAAACDAAGRRDEALALWEQLLPLRSKVNGPTAAETLWTMNKLAGACRSSGRNQEAIALLKQLCELDPTDTNASLKLASWQARFGQDTDSKRTQPPEGTNQSTNTAH